MVDHRFSGEGIVQSRQLRSIQSLVSELFG